MSITPSGPQPSEGNSEVKPEVSSYEAASTPRWVLLVVIALFLGLGGLSYMGYTSRAKLQENLTAADERSDMLATRLDQTNERIAELRGQLDVTSQKLGLTQNELARARTLSQEIQRQQLESDAQLGAQIGEVRQEAQDQFGQVATELSSAKTDIAVAQKDLAETRSILTGTVGDLGVQSGLIARNREELETLKLISERNIYDFDIVKSKRPQRVGPIQIALRRADPKRYRFTLTVVADDKAVEKKDRNINEPMQFYVQGVRTPYEIVVFEVAKDRVTGYLSTPKERASSAVPAAASGVSAASAPTSTP